MTSADVGTYTCTYHGCTLAIRQAGEDTTTQTGGPSQLGRHDRQRGWERYDLSGAALFASGTPRCLIVKAQPLIQGIDDPYLGRTNAYTDRNTVAINRRAD
jgi:hypothetical protein